MNEPQIWYDPVKTEYALHDGKQVFVVSPEMRELLLQQCAMTDTEREALCKRIDELCAENERLRADQAHWELGNCPSCPNVVSLQEALEQNARLRGLVDGAMNEADRLTHDAAVLQIENAKLLMLCADMWEAIKTHRRINFAQLLRFGGRVRKLGVEVDEC